MAPPEAIARPDQDPKDDRRDGGPDGAARLRPSRSATPNPMKIKGHSCHTPSSESSSMVPARTSKVIAPERDEEQASEEETATDCA